MSVNCSAGSDAELPSAMRQRSKPPRELTGRMVLVGLLAIFAVVVGANGMLVHKALSTFGGVETDSSYRAGQLFERDVAMARAQGAQHWRVEASVTSAADGSALLDIVAHDDAGLAVTGIDATATFERPTDRRLDRSVAVSEDTRPFSRQRSNIARAMGPGHRIDAPRRAAIPIQELHRLAVNDRDDRNSRSVDVR